MGYRFIRLGWGSSATMSEDLTEAILPDEDVVSMSADNDVILILVKTKERFHDG